jgi:spore photoproduct lyase
LKRYIPKRVIIEDDVKDSPIICNLLARIPHATPVEYIDDSSALLRGEGYTPDKGEIIVVKNRGRFIKPCPGSKGYTCCGYYILNLALNCPLSCSYCILQSYLNTPFFIIYANIDDLTVELKEFMDKRGKPMYRIGTGEFTDSLVLDHLIDYVDMVAPLFSASPHTILELKTKTAAIEGLIKLKNRERIVASWSLNTPEIIEREEFRTASLEERIEAAHFCETLGYRVGFHFDPLIHYPGWECDYCEVIRHLFERIEKNRIAWISLGALRFMPSLKKVMQSRFPKTRLLHEEFIYGLDGKMRYFKPIRIEMYTRIAEEIRKYDPECFIYLCMESREVWQKSLGLAPASDEELTQWLDLRVR